MTSPVALMVLCVSLCASCDMVLVIFRPRPTVGETIVSFFSVSSYLKKYVRIMLQTSDSAKMEVAIHFLVRKWILGVLLGLGKIVVCWFHKCRLTAIPWAQPSPSTI